jgi:hypothetical protein
MKEFSACKIQQQGNAKGEKSEGKKNLVDGHEH